MEPFRFDQMRPGCYDVDARVRDMDINGVWASVNFPSMITGFCGRVFFNARPRARPGVPSARGTTGCTRSGTSRTRTRIIPLGITFLADPEVAVAEIRRNAERGFTADHAARAPAPDRPARPVAARPLGPDHRGVRRHRHRHVAPRRQLGRRREPGRSAPSAARRHAVRPAVAHRRAPSGCGRSTPCSIPTSRSP